MLDVPDASVPAVEMCWLMSLYKQTHKVNTTPIMRVNSTHSWDNNLRKRNLTPHQLHRNKARMKQSTTHTIIRQEQQLEIILRIRVTVEHFGDADDQADCLDKKASAPAPRPTSDHEYVPISQCSL